MDKAKVAGACLLGLLVLTAITITVYLGAWWLRGDTKNRQVKIDNRNVGVQTAWRDEALDHITEFELLQNSPQAASAQAAEADRACDLIGRLTDNYRTDPRIDAFAERYCQ